MISKHPQSAISDYKNNNINVSQKLIILPPLYVTVVTAVGVKSPPPWAAIWVVM